MRRSSSAEERRPAPRPKRNRIAGSCLRLIAEQRRQTGTRLGRCDRLVSGRRFGRVLRPLLPTAARSQARRWAARLHVARVAAECAQHGTSPTPAPRAMVQAICAMSGRVAAPARRATSAAVAWLRGDPTPRPPHRKAGECPTARSTLAGSAGRSAPGGRRRKARANHRRRKGRAEAPRRRGICTSSGGCAMTRLESLFGLMRSTVAVRGQP
jgi:hypothetical protein